MPIPPSTLPVGTITTLFVWPYLDDDSPTYWITFVGPWNLNNRYDPASPYYDSAYALVGDFDGGQCLKTPDGRAITYTKPPTEHYDPGAPIGSAFFKDELIIQPGAPIVSIQFVAWLKSSEPSTGIIANEDRTEFGWGPEDLGYPRNGMTFDNIPANPFPVSFGGAEFAWETGTTGSGYTEFKTAPIIEHPLSHVPWTREDLFWQGSPNNAGLMTVNAAEVPFKPAFLGDPAVSADGVTIGANYYALIVDWIESYWWYNPDDGTYLYGPDPGSPYVVATVSTVVGSVGARLGELDSDILITIGGGGGGEGGGSGEGGGGGGEPSLPPGPPPPGGGGGGGCQSGILT